MGSSVAGKKEEEEEEEEEEPRVEYPLEQEYREKKEAFEARWGEEPWWELCEEKKQPVVILQRTFLD